MIRIAKSPSAWLVGLLLLGPAARLDAQSTSVRIEIETSDSFRQGQKATYKVTISNSDPAQPLSVDQVFKAQVTLDPGLALISMAGDDNKWKCAGADDYCTLQNRMNVNDKSIITVTVNVLENAVSPQSILMKVKAGGKDIAANGKQNPIEAAGKRDDLGSNLKNLGFGVALGLRWRTPGQEDIVDDATVDANGIVRVNKRSNTSAGLMLEMHYFPKQWGRFGVGPFVGVQAGTDQVIQAVGVGGMFGWKIKEEERKGFGLGAGYAAVPSAKTLGDEFVNGQPAPRAQMFLR